MPKASTTLIYGTNLGGYRVAFTLGRLGHKTIMLNRGSYVDEIKNQVLCQLPLDLCWSCSYNPQRAFIGLGFMEVFYNADILEVKGKAGNFKVKVTKRDPYVDNFICTECDRCVEACPIQVKHADETRKACFVLPKIGWENIYLIDEKACTRCGDCEKACPTGALKLDRPVEEMELPVGAIILAPEFDEPDEDDLAPFGWNRIPNVVKNGDLARASLPTNFIQDSFRRPSDGTLPTSVAVIVTPQFNRRGVEYESYNASVQAVYRANKIKEILPHVEVTVFCREYRGFGKGQYRMYERALANGVNILRPETLKVSKASGDRTAILYGWGGKEHRKEVDLSILIFGQKSPQQMEKLSRICGIDSDEHGFCKVEPFSLFRTKAPGIFALGEFTAPKGNLDMVWEGYGSVREILEHLGERNVAAAKPPVLRNVDKEVPRVGVFICSCFGSFTEKMDLQSLAKRVRSLRHVHHVEIIEGCCTPSTIQATVGKIQASGVNRVVLAACTPMQKRVKFRKMITMSGLNLLLAEFLRLREDVIRVHEDPKEMEDKATALIHAAVAKLKAARAAGAPRGTVGSRILVIGGGPAGLEAARSLVGRGFGVDLVEKSGLLGGMTNVLFRDLEGRDFRSFMDRLINDVEESESITVFKKATVVDVTGYAGNFRVTVKGDQGDCFELSPAVVIIGTGAHENKVKDYQHGQDPRVMTQLEMEAMIEKGEITKGRVAMIQCVGSRNAEVPYCSRVCCSHAIKNALALRQRGLDVTIFYRDINTYGFKEDYYYEAVEKGVDFIRFDKRHYPTMEDVGDSLEISCKQYSNGESLKVSADFLVLSVGIVANRNTNEGFAKMFKLRLDEDGYYDVETCTCPFEDSSKRIMKSFEFYSNGVFPIGLAYSPCSLIEALLMAKQAAAKALLALPSGQMPAPNGVFVSEVDPSKCVGCGLCIDVCPYNARRLDPVLRITEVSPFLCDSCGACATACQSGAAFLRDYREEQTISSIDALLAEG